MVMKAMAAALAMTLFGNAESISWLRGFAQAAKEPAKTIAVGEKVPEFSVTDLTGKTCSLSELQKGEKPGKTRPVVLTFWCTTCNSCRTIEQRLDNLARDYRGKAFVAGLDVNTGETSAIVGKFMQMKGQTFPVLFEPAGGLVGRFGAMGTTFTVVIDAQGILRYRGDFSQEQAGAEVALAAVLAGREVAVKETRQKLG